MSFVSTRPQLFFSKDDPDDPRLGDYFKSFKFDVGTPEPMDFALFGYPDDEGIKLNGGRVGAAQAPQMIRQFLYKMSWPMKSSETLPRFLDLGDLDPAGTLASRHEEALQNMFRLQKQNVRTISFGGGHDYGYSDTAGFVKAHLGATEKPLVINFDAHLDVRPTHNGFNSGTPFYRLLSEFGDQIDFVEIGLQPQCNSQVHREWALKNKAQLFNLQDIKGPKIFELFEKPVFKRLTRKTPVYVSFDIDCLTSTEASGCSQSWVTGLRTQDCLDFLAALYGMCDTRGLGIYEVSPPLDQDFRTSKTAALIAYFFLFPT